MFDRLRGRFAGEPIDRIREANAEDAALTKRAAALERQLTIETRSRLDGIDGAADRGKAIENELATVGRRRRELHAIVTAASAEMTAAAEQVSREAKDRPKLIAALRAQRERLMAETQQSGAQIARNVGLLRENGEAINAAFGLSAAQGPLSFGALVARLQAGLAPLFALNPAEPLTVRNSLLGIASPFVGAAARRTMSEAEQLVLDDVCPYVEGLEAAHAAQDRRAERGDKTVIVGLAGGVFMLVPVARAFADRAQAERALTVAGAGMQVAAAVDGGVALIPAELAAA